MYLGLDLGTSGVKALLIAEDQTILASASAPLRFSPRARLVQQDPADWIAATETALTDLAEAHPLSQVHGIGLSGQMHGAVLLDEADAVLRPAILWNDTRWIWKRQYWRQIPGFEA